MLSSEAIAAALARLIPERVRSASWMQPRYPLIGIELRDDAVLAVRLQRRGQKLELVGQARRALAPETLQSGVMKLAIGDPRGLIRAVRDALKLVGAENAHKISVAIPDPVVRVFLVDVQDLPASTAQAAELIRLRIKKSVPLRLEDTRLSWQALGRLEDGRLQVLVCLAPESALRPLELLLGQAGLRAGLIDIASFDLLNSLRSGRTLAAPRGGDMALINATPSYFSTMILRGERLIFYRSKNYHVQGGFQGEESLRVVGRELKTSLSYYHEHLLGEGLSSTWIRASGVDGRAIAEIAQQAGCADPRPSETIETVAGLNEAGEIAATDLLPALGLVLRRSA